MTRSVSRSPLFHKGLTVFTPNGTALPRSAPAPAAATAPDTEGSDNELLSAHHIRAGSNERP